MTATAEDQKALGEIGDLAYGAYSVLSYGASGLASARGVVPQLEAYASGKDADGRQTWPGFFDEVRVTARGTAGAVRAVVGAWGDPHASARQKTLTAKELLDTALRVKNRAKAIDIGVAAPETAATAKADASVSATVARETFYASIRQRAEPFLDRVLDPRVASYLRAIGFGSLLGGAVLAFAASGAATVILAAAVSRGRS